MKRIDVLLNVIRAPIHTVKGHHDALSAAIFSTFLGETRRASTVFYMDNAGCSKTNDALMGVGCTYIYTVCCKVASHGHFLTTTSVQRLASFFSSSAFCSSSHMWSIHWPNILVATITSRLFSPWPLHRQKIYTSEHIRMSETTLSDE